MRFGLLVSACCLLQLTAAQLGADRPGKPKIVPLKSPEELDLESVEHQATKAGVHVQVADIYIPDVCDRKTKVADHIQIKYVGTIDESSLTGTPGYVFDKTVDDPLALLLGDKQVLPGWNYGLRDLCVGQKVILIVPPLLGFNTESKVFPAGLLPANATLRYEVELVSISDKPPPPLDMFRKIDTNNDGQITRAEALAHFQKHGREKLPKGMWKHADKNMDGVISWEEFDGPKGKAPDPKTRAPPVRGYMGEEGLDQFGNVMKHEGMVDDEEKDEL